jgi:glycosyltransferase involved in cell wall biosynthesis
MTDVALVHDYLAERRGAERVVLALTEVFPEAVVHTALFDPERTFAGFATCDVRPMPINRIPGLRADYRLAFAYLAPSFTATRVEADVTIASSSGWAHGVRTTGAKIVFCHSPARWLYQRGRYLGPAPAMSARIATSVLGPPLRAWDRRAARSADRYLAVSRAKAAEIADIYGIEAEVVHSPMSLDVGGSRRPVAGLDAGFLLCIAADRPYKNVGAVIEAMRALPAERLVVVSRAVGSRVEIPPNVEVLDEVGDDELRWLYANCSGLISAAFEDLGLTPVEAAAHGKPAAVLRYGGHLETVIEGATGVFFETASPAAIGTAVTELLAGQWDAGRLRAHAAGFSLDIFAEHMRRVVREVTGPT